MPAMVFKGLKGLPIALKEFAKKIPTDLTDRTMTPIMQEARQRLEGDTPVITGRLLRSTVVVKAPAQQTLGQFAPYSNVVNNRRGYWQGAIQVLRKWPPYYARTVGLEWGILARQYGGH